MSVLVESTLCSCSIHILLKVRVWDWCWVDSWTDSAPFWTWYRNATLFPQLPQICGSETLFCPVQITMWTRPWKYRYLICAVNNLGSGRSRNISSVLQESEGKRFSTFLLVNYLFLECMFAFGAVKSLSHERRTILKPLLISSFAFDGTQHFCFPLKIFPCPYTSRKVILK